MHYDPRTEQLTFQIQLLLFTQYGLLVKAAQFYIHILRTGYILPDRFKPHILGVFFVKFKQLDLL